jgi:hypothetical protein
MMPRKNVKAQISLAHSPACEMKSHALANPVHMLDMSTAIR